MNSKSISFIFMLLSVYLVSAFPLETRLHKRSCSKTYKVVKGDTCYKIWTKYGLSESKLRNLNSGLSCSALKVGTSLCVANDSSGSSSGSSSCSTTHTVKSGETCYKIWNKYGLTESKLRELNSGLSCSNLKTGTKLCVSGSSGSSSSSCKSHYTIQSGDTCYKIWKKYGLSESSFKNMNSSIDCSKLRKGDKVCVNTSSNSSTSTSTNSHASSSFTWYKECVHSKNYALTFDDGVYKYDNDLLALLKRKGVKATFFINGNNVSEITSSSVRKTIKRMYDEGHNVLSHTYSHSDLSKIDRSSIRTQLKRLEDEIYNIIGKRPKSIRPPYGRYNDSAVESLKHYGYSYGILWNVDTEDWKNGGNADKALEFIKKGLSKSDRPIILNHSYFDDISKDRILKLVEKEIDYLNGKGLKAVTMETCIGHNVYRSSGEGFPN